MKIDIICFLKKQLSWPLNVKKPIFNVDVTKCIIINQMYVRRFFSFRLSQFERLSINDFIIINVILFWQLISKVVDGNLQADRITFVAKMTKNFFHITNLAS